MDSLSLGDQPGIERMIADSQPAHYTVKVQSFSLFTKNAIDKYESGVFQAGGYKWKLLIHPNGNKSRNAKDHISMYLSIAETTSLPQGWEIHAVVRFFLLDQNQDNYLAVQATKERRFREMTLEWGFDQFLPLKAFMDTRNGYLVDDTCVFGVEVFVTRERSAGNGENLTLVKDALVNYYYWNIDGYSKIVDKEFVESAVFMAGDQRWQVRLHPLGKGAGAGNSVSLYLKLVGAESLPPTAKIFAEFSLRIVDQLQSRNYYGKATHWFSKSSPDAGWAKFISRLSFMNPNTGTLVKDNAMVVAAVTIHGTSVNEGHPDKLCDQISNAILDACLAQDPESKVACETCTKTNMVMVFDEITTRADVNY
ncbi:hypothetical protein MLD38_017924 [Melastoma candidum]|uniref:Uncharacterized protein n=1 Tax=Melastoma candidum TaxID=119954 RepID=A0ACB9QS77_9MYRT|nr:hypothetical protein MLD38_017924 [Melastoma candidum]